MILKLYIFTLQICESQFELIVDVLDANPVLSKMMFQEKLENMHTHTPHTPHTQTMKAK